MLSTYTSDQSKQEAAPWSKFALQYHDGQILPESVTDEELSSQFRQCYTPAKVPLSSPPSKRDRRSHRKPQNRKSCKKERDNIRSNLRVDKGASSNPGNSAVSPATSSTSTNGGAGRGGRQTGYQFSEEDRRNAEGVRNQGACYRCYSMKEKVGFIYPSISAKMRLTVGQSAHMDNLPAIIAGGSMSIANSGFGRLPVASKDSRNDMSICCRVS
jgi:hypothetical protein